MTRAVWRFGRPRRRSVVVLAVVAITLIAVFIGVDRVTAGIAADRVNQQVEVELAARGVTHGSSQSRVGGFPFLTQAARGRFDEVTVDLTDVRSEGIRMSTVTVVAQGVRAQTSELLNGGGKVTVDTLTGTGVINWSSLADLANAQSDLPVTDLSLAPSGDQVRALGTAVVAGHEVRMTAVGAVAINDGAVELRLTGATLADTNVPSVVRDAVAAAVGPFTVQIKIPPLPFGLAPSQLRVVEAGLEVVAVARALSLADEVR